jgi:MFS family permease
MLQGTMFARWWIVFGATAAMLVAQGPVILYTLGHFIKPLNAEFGWDRASISAAGGIAAIASAITIPFVGSMMDRWGVRAVLLPVVVLCASSVALIALAPPSITVFMLLFCNHRHPGLGPRAARLCQMRLGMVRRQARPGARNHDERHRSGSGAGAAVHPVSHWQFRLARRLSWSRSC